MILSAGPLLDVDPEVLEVPAPEASSTVDISLEEIEKSHILRVLGKTRWVIEGSEGAAAILGLHPNSLPVASRSLDSRGMPTNDRSSHEISWWYPIRSRDEVAPARSPE